MRGWLIGGVFAILAAGAAQGADLTALRGEISEPPSDGSPVSSYTLGLRYWFSNGRHDYASEDFGAGLAAVPPGAVLFGKGQKVGDYTASWNMVRIGAEGTWTIVPQLILTVDAALVPYAQGQGDDSHLLRQDSLGLAPNVFLRGHGWGGQTDAMLRYAVSDALSVGVGSRYWYLDGSNGFKTDRVSRLFGGQRLPLATDLSERHGLLTEAQHKF